MAILGTKEWCEAVCKTLNESDYFKSVVADLSKAFGFEEAKVVATIEDLPLHIVFEITNNGCKRIWATADNVDELKPLLQVSSNLEAWVALLVKRDLNWVSYVSALRIYYDRELKITKVAGQDPTPETLRMALQPVGFQFLDSLIMCIKDAGPIELPQG